VVCYATYSRGSFSGVGIEVGGSRSSVLSGPPTHTGATLLSPGSLGYGFGFASGDTKPYIFWHHQHLTGSFHT